MSEPVNPDPAHPEPDRPEPTDSGPTQPDPGSAQPEARTAQPDLLLSDAERLHALTALGDHFAAGRMGPSEFYDRSGEVAAARTLSQLAPPFKDLPGGVPLQLVGGQIVQAAIAGGGELVPMSQSSSPSTSTTGGLPAPRAVDAELAELRKRGKTIESLDSVVVGVTLVSFLILQFVVGWDFAWIVWPSLALTLGIPRLILRFNDDDEATYEKIKKSDQKARDERLRAANDRIRELGDGRDSND